MWLNLTRGDNNNVLINLSNVAYIYPKKVRGDSTPAFTEIQFVNGNFIEVKEPYKEIMELIREGNS